MRLKIKHSTVYRYDPPATGAIQILRMTPGSYDGQYVADWQIDISNDTRVQVQEDAFGNTTHMLTHGPLSELTIIAEGLVDTQNMSGVLKGTDERFPPNLFLRTTELTEPSSPIRHMARNLMQATNRNALGFLHALMTRIFEEMAFDTDQTDANTTATEAYAMKRGVCQDYAHIFIAAARSAGVPARYISGYFLRSDGVQQQDAGHAWVEAYVPDLGWIGFDPANGICTTDAHVRVAVGVDYLSAAPVRGTRYGGGTETMTISVHIEQSLRGSQSQSQSMS